MGLRRMMGLSPSAGRCLLCRMLGVTRGRLGGRLGRRLSGRLSS
jgi:hypothetical protein